MVGIPQNNLRIDVVSELLLVHSFNRTNGANWHKNGRLNGAVSGV